MATPVLLSNGRSGFGPSNVARAPDGRLWVLTPSPAYVDELIPCHSTDDGQSWTACTPWRRDFRDIFSFPIVKLNITPAGELLVTSVWSGGVAGGPSLSIGTPTPTGDVTWQNTVSGWSVRGYGWLPGTTTQILPQANGDVVTLTTSYNTGAVGSPYSGVSVNRVRPDGNATHLAHHGGNFYYEGWLVGRLGPGGQQLDSSNPQAWHVYFDSSSGSLRVRKYSGAGTAGATIQAATGLPTTGFRAVRGAYDHVNGRLVILLQYTNSARVLTVLEGASTAQDLGHTPSGIRQERGSADITVDHRGRIRVVASTGTGLQESVYGGTTWGSWATLHAGAATDQALVWASSFTTLPAYNSPAAWRQGAGSYAVRNLLGSPPNAPSPTSPTDGAVLDRDVAHQFAWLPSDPDPGDTQSKYDLRYRPIGASSWTTLTATTPQPYRNMPGGTFAATGYEWQVRTYDASGAVGPWSSSSFFTAATAPGLPTITSPADGAEIPTGSLTVEWSYPTQQGYQAQLLDETGAVLADTGQVASTTIRSATFNDVPNGSTRRLRVRVSDDGLWSPWAQVTVHVSYTPPPSPSFTIGADEQTGSLLISVTNPAPSGTEPQVAYNRIEVDDADGRGWGTRHGSAMVARNGAWRYWLARSGVDYRERVRVVAVGENGTSSTTTGAS